MLGVVGSLTQSRLVQCSQVFLDWCVSEPAPTEIRAQEFDDADVLVAALGIGNVDARYKELVEVASDGLGKLDLELADRRQLRFR